MDPGRGQKCSQGEVWPFTQKEGYEKGTSKEERLERQTHKRTYSIRLERNKVVAAFGNVHGAESELGVEISNE